MRRYLALAGFVAVSLLAGIIGSYFTASSVAEWYPALEKPSFNPPSWVFAPVWTYLYITMGISAFLIFERGGKSRMPALTLFFIQLLLNASWSILFFGYRSPALGFLVILPLWATIAILTIRSYGIDKRATLLLMPYLAWVSFASILNLAIIILN